MFRSRHGFRPYVPVAKRIRKISQQAAKLAAKGAEIEPVRSEGRTIAHSFWGKAWCANLEAYSDYENRLPRGRSYLRNGAVVHLSLQPGRIEALVSGSALYTVSIGIRPFAPARWSALCGQCSGHIGSLVELLQGRLSDQVMEHITRRDTGLFPSPSEIRLSCSCPDWAGMCKHIAAVLYGVGVRLDSRPELLFTLRSVEQNDLIAHATTAASFTVPDGTPAGAGLADAELSALFGIEMEEAVPALPAPPQAAVPAREPRLAAVKTAAPATAPTMAPTPPTKPVRDGGAKAKTRNKAVVKAKVVTKSKAKAKDKPKTKLSATSSTVPVRGVTQIPGYISRLISDLGRA